MTKPDLQFNGRHLALLPALAISTAVGPIVTPAFIMMCGLKYLVVQALFLYGSGGTTVDGYIQTSLDLGVTWIDIMNFHFATAAATKVSAVVNSTALAAGITPGDGSLTANTILSGLLGDRIRAKYTTVGTYAGATSLQLDAIAKG